MVKKNEGKKVKKCQSSYMLQRDLEAVLIRGPIRVRV
jgi:hypothetical protein